MNATDEIGRVLVVGVRGLKGTQALGEIPGQFLATNGKIVLERSIKDIEEVGREKR